VYNHLGQLQAITDANGQNSGFSYDAGDNLTSAPMR
jgi:YD repeat-containing protein